LGIGRVIEFQMKCPRCRRFVTFIGDNDARIDDAGVIV